MADRVRGVGLFPVAAAAALSLAISSPVSADIGAGIGADPIALAQPAAPGHGYALPPVYVVNTGSEPSRYVLQVQRIRESEDATVPAQWIEFGKNDFTLGPKETASVPIKLNLPGDAKPGSYSSNVVVGTVPPNAPAGGTALGARAATDLRFQVAKSGPAIPWPWPWWSYAALGGALLLGGGAALSRRLGIRIQLERRT